MSIDIALTSNHDLDLSTRDIVFKSADNQIAQQVTILLRTLRSEWFLNTEHGIPYFENVFVKNANRAEIQSILKAKIKEIKGVVSVKSFDLKIDAQQRILSIKMTIKTSEKDNEIEVQL